MEPTVIENIAKDPRPVLERISDNMFAVFDESKSDLVVFAATLESAASAFDNIVSIGRGEMEYYRETIQLATRLINWQENEVDPKIDNALVTARNFVKRLQGGEASITDLIGESDSLLALIDSVMTDDRVKSRHQRRCVYRLRRLSAEFDEKGLAVRRAKV